MLYLSRICQYNITLLHIEMSDNMFESHLFFGNRYCYV